MFNNANPAGDKKRSFGGIMKKLIATAVSALALCTVLSSCGSNNEVDTSGMFLVTYVGNGGFFEGNRTGRELYYTAGDLINAPTVSVTGSEISSSTLGKITRRGYTFNGWYTAETAAYIPDTSGEYIKIDGIYRRNDQGGFVLVYDEDANGAYCLKITETTDANGETIRTEEYVLFDPNDTSLSDFVRYEQRYVAYDSDLHEGLLRYELLTGDVYCLIDEIFTLRFDGEYVKNQDDTFSYVGKNSDSTVKYGFLPEYIISDTDVTASQRYNAEFSYNESDKWDFSSDRMPERNVTLYANWTPALTVTYVYWDNSSFSVFSNQKGSLITKPTGTAKDGNGRTFVGWSKSRDEYLPWDFNTDIYPSDLETNVLTLYAYYKDGDYIRIANAADLKTVANKPDGKYLLCDNISLEGSTGNPFGFSKDAVFTGSFDGNGFTISDIKISGVNKLIDPASIALFNYVKDAYIHDLTVETTITVSSNSTGNVVLGAIVGTDNGGSKISGCKGKVSFGMNGVLESSIDIRYGAVVGKKSATTTLENNDITVESASFKTSGMVTNAG